MKFLRLALIVVLFPLTNLVGQDAVIVSMPLDLHNLDFTNVTLHIIPLKIQGCQNPDYIRLKALDSDRVESQEKRYQLLHQRCLIERPVGESAKISYHAQNEYNQEEDLLARQNTEPRTKGKSFIIGAGIGLLSGLGYVVLASGLGWEITATGISLVGMIVPGIFEKENKVAAILGGLIGSTVFLSGIFLLILGGG